MSTTLLLQATRAALPTLSVHHSDPTCTIVTQDACPAVFCRSEQSSCGDELAERRESQHCFETARGESPQSSKAGGYVLSSQPADIQGSPCTEDEVEGLEEESSRERAKQRHDSRNFEPLPCNNAHEESGNNDRAKERHDSKELEQLPWTDKPEEIDGVEVGNQGGEMGQKEASKPGSMRLQKLCPLARFVDQLHEAWEEDDDQELDEQISSLRDPPPSSSTPTRRDLRGTSEQDVPSFITPELNRTYHRFKPSYPVARLSPQKQAMVKVMRIQRESGWMGLGTSHLVQLVKAMEEDQAREAASPQGPSSGPRWRCSVQ